MQIIIAQLNFTVGAFDRNAQQIINTINDHDGDLFLFPELALCGYSPEDLLLRKDFLDANLKTLQMIIQNMPANKTAVIGYAELAKDKVFNSAAVIQKNKLLANHRKQLLPNYGVFDERRYFTQGDRATVFNINNINFGVTICEDLWFAEPALMAKNAGAQVLISINASPFFVDKPQQRLAILQQRIGETAIPILYVHHCGGQDDFIFDGSSQVINAKGELIAQAPFGQTHLLSLQIEPKTLAITAHDFYPTPTPYAQIYQALVMGVRDYVHKNGFSKVVLGFSGGIDSALTLAIAVDALGVKNVLPVLLPSRYTANLSLTAAYEQLKLMHLTSKEISIEPLFSASLASLHYDVNNPPSNLMTQNMQARARGLLLMALANRDNFLLLNTSNKSEIAVGYGTLYGDLCGAYAVLKDVWKTEVFKLAHYRNQQTKIIPTSIIERAPSAELAPNQQDTDNLPPYDELDAILKLYIEQDQSSADIIAQGFNRETVSRVISLVKLNEYKRHQTPLGPRVSTKAFTRERRYPITTAFA